MNATFERTLITGLVGLSLSIALMISSTPVYAGAVKGVTKGVTGPAQTGTKMPYPVKPKKPPRCWSGRGHPLPGQIRCGGGGPGSPPSKCKPSGEGCGKQF
jgi:hypothetical protein